MKKKSKKLVLSKETLHAMTAAATLTYGPSRCQIYTCTCPATVRASCDVC